MATNWIPRDEEYQKYREEVNEVIWDIVGNRYGGYLDIATALKLVDELDMSDGLAQQINEVEAETFGNEQIDPVSLVLSNAIRQTENELNHLGVSVSFSKFGSFTDFVVSLKDTEKANLLDTLRLDGSVFDDLSTTAIKLFEIANCEIKDLKRELEEENNEFSDDISEEHRTSMVRKR